MTRGVAWSVPVVAIAAAAPSASASTAPPAADALYIAGPTTAKVGNPTTNNYTYRIYGQANGDQGGEYPTGTTLRFPADFVIVSVGSGGGIISGQNVIFPAGTEGSVRGYFTTTGSKTITATAPGLDDGSITTTVNPA